MMLTTTENAEELTMVYDVLVTVTVIDEEGSEVDASMSGVSSDRRGIRDAAMQLARMVAADAQAKVVELSPDDDDD